MRRRELFAAFIATVLGASIAAAQQPKIARVGVLSPADNEATVIFEAFRRGLRELGYIEGRNIILEYRFAGGDHTPAGGGTRKPAGRHHFDRRRKRSAGCGPSDPHDPDCYGCERRRPRGPRGCRHPRAPGRQRHGVYPHGSRTQRQVGRLVHTAFPKATGVTALVNPANASSEAHLHITEETARALGLAVG